MSATRASGRGLASAGVGIRTAGGRPSTPRRQWRPTTTTQRTRRTNREVTAMGLFGLGLPEIAVIAGVGILLFGPSKIPELGKTLGKTVRGLQDAAQEFKEELDEELARPSEDEAKEADESSGED
ncbi:twin arginine-targeting-like sec-independent protein translocator protein [Chloropicon primus]|uniref:Twin arginine-targeting-like sec-independent protein translocator protein n=1 Tax=Chloropicon primus TaxID=1764295 RepID=A0A5B8ML07_9CHLO|nr:twin arginine-targeting-like sec-independent protein translocator protein [Chloropicon primus]UPQ99594.1 twin arginine-targeting-like sec-independent protein translocator protein [Chloropicon primus]|eukprot:QDZ20385.1 twin arginine-targeting-like sec-independent protein translocator protein [Chloropicon primus]